MRKKYSTLFFNVKNGKNCSNVFYRFSKPIAIFAITIAFLFIFIGHAIFSGNYVDKTEYIVYIFDNAYGEQKYKSEILIPVQEKYKKVQFYYFDYKNPTDESKEIMSYYNIEESMSYWSNRDSGRAVFYSTTMDHAYVSYFISQSVILETIKRLKWFKN